MPMNAESQVDLSQLYTSVLRRQPSAEELARVSAVSLASHFRLLQELLSSAEFARACLEQALDVHLYFIHAARVKLVCTMIPEAAVIVDLGGANGNLYDMGYPHAFQELTVVDLPSDERCEMYRGIKMRDRELHFGKISILYSNMTNLSAIGDASVDLIWMGQTIEHITEEDSFRVYEEIKRILRPEGCFCLDTPNRNLTEIHTGGGWIHPEHKIEYRPTHLKNNLLNSGFTIEEELGLCEMIRTCRTGYFDYADFFLGAALNTNVEGSYIQYYRCRIIA